MSAPTPPRRIISVGGSPHERSSNRQSTLDNRQLPVATISPQGSTIRIVRVNNAAQQARIKPGQTLTEAKAVVPELVTYDDDPSADRRQLEALALWAQCLSPTVHLEGDETLLLDVSGCDRLFRGEQNLLQQAIQGLAKQGFTCRAAIADTPGAAWAIAHAHPDSAVVAEPGISVTYLSHLPTWALRIDQRVVHDLHRVGIDTIGSLLHLPRSSLTSRFGSELLDRIDQALGDLPELLTPYRPQPAMSQHLEFGGTTDRIEVLAEAVRQAVTNFCVELNRRTAGVRQLFVTFRCPDVRIDGATQDRNITLEVSLSQATRSARHLLSLLRVRLDELKLPAPTDSLTAWARQTEHLEDEQIDLFDSGTQDVRSLSDLLDRLAVRLGPSSIVRPQLLSEHQPEYAFVYRQSDPPRRVNCATKRRSDEGKVKKAKSQKNQKPFQSSLSGALRFASLNQRTEIHRPLRLLKQPAAIVATSVVPDGPPIVFQFQGIRHLIAAEVGPECIETGWWRGAHVQRDYYRVLSEQGRRFWIFRARDTSQWYLQGWFD
jgi:protein ImuB